MVRTSLRKLLLTGLKLAVGITNTGSFGPNVGEA